MTQPSRRTPSLLFAFALSALLVLLTACSSGTESEPEALATQPLAPTATPVPEPTAVPTPVIVRRDIQATRLRIPSLGIDSPVGRSEVIPYVDMPLPGCPRSDSTETLTVPNQGIVTPAEPIEGMENKSWIFGHSRWLGAPGILFRLQDIKAGDEVILDGKERATGQDLKDQRFVVDALYISDTDSGDELVNAKTPADIPHKPVVVLQTSIREDGPGKQWILDREKLTAKAQTTVQGDINDTCKYLLLFVFAKAVE